MIFFIAIVFIAEIIIAVTVILNIVKLDDNVNSFNTSVLEGRTRVIEGIKTIRITICEIIETAQNAMNFMVRKRKQYLLNVFNNFISSLVLILLKGRYRKAFLAFKLIGILKDSYSDACRA